MPVSQTQARRIDRKSRNYAGAIGVYYLYMVEVKMNIEIVVVVVLCCVVLAKGVGGVINHPRSTIR